jgi:hypothetical protein
MRSHPQSDEYGAFYAGYVERVQDDPVDAMAAQIHLTSTLLQRLSDAQALHRYTPDKWSVKEVVAHMADVERIMAYRALRIARGDATPLASFDENAYVPIGRFDRRSLADLLAELKTVRAASLVLFRSFDDEAWVRRGTASGKPVSVRALACIIPGHERHHDELFRTRYGLS